jgi:5-methylcytosine-specific restriction protein A
LRGVPAVGTVRSAGRQPIPRTTHTRRLSDGGPYDPRYGAEICPTCHCRIHYGTDGDAVNSRVMAYVARIET